MMPANMLGRNDSMVKTQKRNDMKQIEREKNTTSKRQEERMERRKRTKKA